jgi:hypothetical protein
MLNTPVSIDARVLFASPCVIELKQVVSDDEKAFIMGLLLIRLYEFYEGGQGGSPTGDLAHVTLIEEAHRLLRNVSTEQGGDAANPKGRAIEVFGNILSEIRAYGEGILIAEQVPVKLLPDAIKNTNLKIVHRMVAQDDREIVGGTMNLTPPQTRFLTTLSTGQAVVYTEGMRKPVHLQVGLAPVKRSGGRVRADEIAATMRPFYQKHPEVLYPFAGCKTCPKCSRALRCGAKESDPAFEQPFLALFNAMREGIAVAEKAYTDFLAIYDRHQVRLTNRTSPHCLFTGLLNQQLQRRAELYGWSVEQTRKFEEAYLLLFTTLEEGTPSADDFTHLKAYSASMHNFSALPFEACSLCKAQCQYRYDAQAPVDPDLAQGYREATKTSQVDARESFENLVVLKTVNTMRSGFHHEQRESVLDAAYCYSVQQLEIIEPRKALRLIALKLVNKYLHEGQW